ncbi:MAG: glycosyltransferase group 1 protein [Caulobacteraceae bacterium]|nr:glycosyltransferase group 1 protein [Caulobacteraceae bacterium]
MARVLFLAHRVPFPPDKGDKIRAFNILRHLARSHEVWLGAGADDLSDLQHVEEARRYCRDVHFAPLAPLRRAANMAAALATGAPLSVARFRHPELEHWTRRVLAEVKPDIIYVYSSAMAQYVLGRAPPTSRVVIDFVDCDAEKWRAYSEVARWPLRAVYRREFDRLRAFELDALADADLSLAISTTEQRLLTGFYPALAGKLHVVPNGVDLEYYAPCPLRVDSATIVMCGRMDYAPNAEGAEWFARQVFPQVQARNPEAVFQIVGAAPTAAVRALARHPGVNVTGAVPDVRPYLARAAVIVAPLRIARGIQNKVLEAMAVARPLVATPQALDGVAAMPGQDVLVAEDPGDFAQACLEAMTPSTARTLSRNGRRFVVRHHEWAAQLAALDELIGELLRAGSAEVAA